MKTYSDTDIWFVFLLASLGTIRNGFDSSMIVKTGEGRNGMRFHSRRSANAMVMIDLTD